MADTLPNILIPPNQWVDLYQASGIAVGTQIRVKILGNGELKLAVSESQPTSLSAYDVLVDKTQPLVNSAGDSGAWAYSVSSEVLINVGVA